MSFRVCCWGPSAALGAQDVWIHRLGGGMCILLVVSSPKLLCPPAKAGPLDGSHLTWSSAGGEGDGQDKKDPQGSWASQTDVHIRAPASQWMEVTAGCCTSVAVSPTPAVWSPAHLDFPNSFIPWDVGCRDFLTFFFTFPCSLSRPLGPAFSKGDTYPGWSTLCKTGGSYRSSECSSQQHRSSRR